MGYRKPLCSKVVQYRKLILDSRKRKDADLKADTTRQICAASRRGNGFGWSLFAGILLQVLGTSGSVCADETLRSYVLWYRNYDSPAIRALVDLALSKTPEYGRYRILRSEELTQGRVLRELSRNRSRLVDIANVATSRERESFLSAIPIPVDGGLLGFRVCLVQGSRLELFENVSTLGEFREAGLRIGQGQHWPDTPILESNGIEVVTHWRYENLSRMLRNERFECFARGVNEILQDIESPENSGLVIEPHLLFAYPMPSYLFVGPENHHTALRLQLGMERAIRDGSFADYLYAYYESTIHKLNLGQRKVIVLRNPHLSEESRQIGQRTLEQLHLRLDLLSH